MVMISRSGWVMSAFLLFLRSSIQQDSLFPQVKQRQTIKFSSIYLEKAKNLSSQRWANDG